MTQRVLTLAYVVSTEDEPVAYTISGSLLDISSALLTLSRTENAISVVLSASDQSVALSLV